MPGGSSFLAFNDFDAEVKGLREIPPGFIANEAGLITTEVGRQPWRVCLL